MSAALRYAQTGKRPCQVEKTGVKKPVFPGMCDDLSDSESDQEKEKGKISDTNTDSIPPILSVEQISHSLLLPTIPELPHLDQTDSVMEVETKVIQAQSPEESPVNPSTESPNITADIEDDDTKPLDDGAKPLDDGAKPLDDGAKPLDDGAKPLDDDTKPLDDGAKPLDDGAKPLDDGAITPHATKTETVETELIDLDAISAREELEEFGLESLKQTLISLGLKCGGTLQERVGRLYMYKITPKEQLPTFLFAGKGKTQAKKSDKR